MSDRDRAIEVCFTASTALRNAGMTTTAGKHHRAGVSLPAEERRQLLALATQIEQLMNALMAGAVDELVTELRGGI